MRVAHLVMCLLFAFSAAVQLNDPDPWRWTFIYGAAAAVCASELRPARRHDWRGRIAPLSLGVVALVWATAIAARSSSRVELGQLFEAWEMTNVAVEERRETFGLIIVALWMLTTAAVRGGQSGPAS